MNKLLLRFENVADFNFIDINLLIDAVPLEIVAHRNKLLYSGFHFMMCKFSGNLRTCSRFERYPYKSWMNCHGFNAFVQ
ncbi:hypothetical protein T4B_3925 [Trichinella pseudospiralis]|uniref:Uncharacterized protein n=1 Tax=Trichinella pseudospiralis TaxID=6337 RepID=A0A0V1IRD6_TRIPS|nr:hypothetical protein T4B_3925 [Trichinella pseudospiralis]